MHVTNGLAGKVALVTRGSRRIGAAIAKRLAEAGATVALTYVRAAGLGVCRADPWLPPPRPRFGSVPAARLAEQARTAPGTLARVTAEGGSLTGRAAEVHEGVRRSEPIRAALAAAGRCFGHGHRDTPRVALTFDDGPDPVHTRRVLEILDRYGVRATFFCVGHHVAALPDEVRRIAAAGHELGNRSWSHRSCPT